MMKKSLFIGIIFVLTIALLTHLFSVYEQHERLEDYVESRFSSDLEVPLNCPPLGLMKVTFATDYSTPEFTRENIPLIMKQWGQLWPPTYQALDNAAKNFNGGDNFVESATITVVLPNASLLSSPDWSIKYTSEGGLFVAEMTGTTVTSAKDDY